MIETRVPPGELLPPEIYAAAGKSWRLFPVAKKGKLPLIKKWQALASSDLEVLAAWATEYPGCNWGLATGKPSGVFVVDVDGEAGRTSLAELEKEGLTFPQTMAVTTGREEGGTHLYFQLPADVDVTNDQSGRIGTHIDVRGTGGFVVAPPSVHATGRVYRCIDHSPEIAEAPAWVIERLTDRASQYVPPAAEPGAQTVGKGSRNNRLVSLAGTMHKRGMSVAAIEQALLAENATFNPPLPVERVQKIAHEIPARYPNPPQAPEANTKIRARVVRLSDVQSKPVRWLLEPYIPIGMLSMISGDPGAGKSFVALAIASDVTKQGGGVLYMTLENPLAEVMRPRLDSLGGDASLFWVVNGTVYEDENGTDERGIITFADLDLLDETIRANRVRLLVIDPITSFFGQGKNANHATDTRPIFDRLGVMAETYDIALMLLRHNNKQQTGKAIHRGSGSVDMTGAVRSEMLAGISPENREQRGLAHLKTNIGRFGPTLGYAIEPDEQGGAKFRWTGELSITAEQLNATAESGPRSKQNEALEWLLTQLREGSKSQKDVRTLAEEAGLNWWTVEKAKKDCKLIKSRKMSYSGGWLWYLDPTPADGRLEI